jgi:hypothetical protein
MKARFDVSESLRPISQACNGYITGQCGHIAEAAELQKGFRLSGRSIAQKLRQKLRNVLKIPKLRKKLRKLR